MKQADFQYSPCPAPHPGLVRCHGDDVQLHAEVADRLRQLAESLSTGEIGYEWYTELSRRELARVGW